MPCNVDSPHHLSLTPLLVHPPPTTLQTPATRASTKDTPSSTPRRGPASAPLRRKTGSTRSLASVVTVTATLRNSGTAQMWRSRPVSNLRSSRSCSRCEEVVLRNLAQNQQAALERKIRPFNDSPFPCSVTPPFLPRTRRWRPGSDSGRGGARVRP